MKKVYKKISKNTKTYIDSNGYRRFNDSGKPLHRYIAEKKLGRKLRAGEVVHHKNRNKQDNSFNNLAVFPSQKEHWKAHIIDAKKYGRQYSLSGKNKK